MGESVLNMTANETQTNEGYLIVGMASSNKSNASQTIAEYYTKQGINPQAQKQTKPLEPKKLEISLKQKEFGCGIEIFFSEPIDTTQLKINA